MRPDVPRGAAQVIDCGAQVVARGAAPCASQVLNRGAEVDALGNATLPQQEKKHAADLKRSRENITRVYLRIIQMRVIMTA